MQMQKPLSAKEIAKLLNVNKSSINHELHYYHNIFFIKDNNYKWSLSSLELKKDIITIDNSKNYVNKITNYITNTFDNDIELFNNVPFHFYSTDDIDCLEIELNIYIICMLLNTVSKVEKISINHSYIRNLFGDLDIFTKNVVNLEQIYNIYIQEFDTLSYFIRQVILSFIRYDDHYETRKSFILINKLRSTFLYIIEIKLNNDSQIKNAIHDHINDLRNYIKNSYDYADGSVDTLRICNSCDELFDIHSGNWIENNFYCNECYKDFDDDLDDLSVSLGSDEEIDIEDNIDVEDEFEEVIDTQQLKQNIIEDCSTCKHSKNKTCRRSYLNQICGIYQYYK